MVSGHRAVTVGDQLPLPFGVVVYVGNERRPLQLPVFLLAAQVHLHTVEQVGLVEGGAIDAVVRRRHGQRAIERIITGAAGKRAIVRHGVFTPVHRLLVVGQEFAPAT